MKTHVVIMLIILCSFLQARANIFNAYLIEKLKLEKKIANSLDLFGDAELNKNKRHIEKRLKCLKKKYNIVLRKYNATETLMSRLKHIDPELYEAVSQVTNAEGILTHIYIRCVYRSDEEIAFFRNNHFDGYGYTSFKQSDANKNICVSQFGDHTISITIWQCPNDVIALAHEFSHVLYLVPNLNSYSNFMYEHANRSVGKKYIPGHHPNDPSRDFIELFEKRFKEKYLIYMSKLRKDTVL